MKQASATNVFVVVLVLLSASCIFAQQIVGTYWFPDKPFPQYMQLWQEGWSFKDEEGNKLIYAKPNMPLGGYLFVYFCNTGRKPIVVSDIVFQGIPLSIALGKSEEPRQPEDKYYSSILLSKLPKQQIEKLKVLGWPVWWKVEPASVEPGCYGKLTVRLRRVPKTDPLKLDLLFNGGRISAAVSIKRVQPRFSTIAFSTDLTTVYLYPCYAKRGVKPQRVYIDNLDVTHLASLNWDRNLDTAAVVVKLTKPLEWMSFHSYRVLYSDGAAAQYAMRTWARELVYGMWSSPGGGSDPESATKSFIEEYVRHNINCVMPYVVGVCRDFFLSDAGWDYCEKMGVGRMTHWPDGKHHAVFTFAMDEPDANDAACRQLDPRDRLGVLGQYLVNWTRVLNDADPQTPVLLNIDNTYKPENWYMYHQLADIPCIDPYYTEQQDLAARGDPYYFQFHTRPTYVQGVCTISQSSCQPKPLHVILCSTRYSNDEGYQGRFPTPEEKRMEVYYAIGSGAKGLSYWWFPKDRYCHGLDERTPEANALWKEIGLLGAEVRTAGPVITTSCPANVSIQASRFLWTRALLCGGDTLAVVVVNENVACDRLGTIVKPVEDARVTIDLPSWITPKSVFEVTCDGLSDVKWSANGRKLTLELGTTKLSRFVVITADTSLKDRLWKRYLDMFAENVKLLKSSE
ncbi:MAG: hypothetical protein QHI38_06115 [Armatimonadota bacterium]|nr:hypothetical protein [Armatimonadota bacterium]